MDVVSRDTSFSVRLDKPLVLLTKSGTETNTNTDVARVSRLTLHVPRTGFGGGESVQATLYADSTGGIDRIERSVHLDKRFWDTLTQMQRMENVLDFKVALTLADAPHVSTPTEAITARSNTPAKAACKRTSKLFKRHTTTATVDLRHKVYQLPPDTGMSTFGSLCDLELVDLDTRTDPATYSRTGTFQATYLQRPAGRGGVSGITRYGVMRNDLPNVVRRVAEGDDEHCCLEDPWRPSVEHVLTQRRREQEQAKREREGGDTLDELDARRAAVSQVSAVSAVSASNDEQSRTEQTADQSMQEEQQLHTGRRTPRSTLYDTPIRSNQTHNPPGPVHSFFSSIPALLGFPRLKREPRTLSSSGEPSTPLDEHCGHPQHQPDEDCARGQIDTHEHELSVSHSHHDHKFMYRPNSHEQSGQAGSTDPVRTATTNAVVGWEESEPELLDLGVRKGLTGLTGRTDLSAKKRHASASLVGEEDKGALGQSWDAEKRTRSDLGSAS
jgi:hypothetical protein